MIARDLKKIIILTLANLILALAIVIFVYYKSLSNKTPVFLRAGLSESAVNSKNLNQPPIFTLPESVSDRLKTESKIKALDFPQSAASSLFDNALNSLRLSVKNYFSGTERQPLGSQKLKSSKNLAPPSPEQVSNLLTGAGSKKLSGSKTEPLVFPKFYLKYLDEMQDLMIGDGFLLSKRVLKTNQDVVLFLENFVDYLIKVGTIPASERPNFINGIKLNLELLKEEAGVKSQSYLGPFLGRIAIFKSGHNFIKWIFGVENIYAQSECYRTASNSPAGHFVRSNSCNLDDLAVFELLRNKKFLSRLFSSYRSLLIRPVHAQITSGAKITQGVAGKAGSFIGRRLGQFLGNKLGGSKKSKIPSVIIKKFTDTLTNKLDQLFSDALSKFFAPEASVIDQTLRSQIEAEFGNDAFLANQAYSDQLMNYFGAPMGGDIYNEMSSEIVSAFNTPESSFFNDITGGLQGLLGDPGKLFGDMMKNSFPIVSAIEKSQAANAVKGGTNLIAPCCKCNEPISGKPIGCLNKLCPAGPAIWDEATKHCGCTTGSAEEALHEAEAQNFDLSPVTGGAAGAGASAGAGVGAVAGNSFSFSGVGSLAGASFGGASLNSGASGGPAWEFANNRGEVVQSLPANNASNVSFDITDETGHVYYSVAANENGYNVYDPNGNLTGTLVNNSTFNSFSLYDDRGAYKGSIVNTEQITSNLLAAPQSPSSLSFPPSPLLGLGRSGTQFHDLLLPDDVLPPPPSSFRYQIPEVHRGDIFMDDNISSDSQSKLKDMVMKARDAFNPAAVGTPDVVVMNRETFGYFGAEMVPGVQPVNFSHNVAALAGTDLVAEGINPVRVIYVSEGVRASPDPSALIAHEYGHAALSRLSLYQQRTWGDTYSDMRRCTCGTTSYGISNDHEAFAETVRLYWQSGGNVNNVPDINLRDRAVLEKSFSFVKSNQIFKMDLPGQ